MRCACRCASAGPESRFRSTVIASVNIDRERTMRGSCLPSRPFQPAFPNRVFHVGKTGAASLADRCGTPVHDRPQGALAGSKAGCADASFPDLPRRATLRTVEVRRGMASSFRRQRPGRFPTRSSWHIDVPFAIRRAPDRCGRTPAWRRDRRPGKRRDGAVSAVISEVAHASQADRGPQ